MRAETDDALKEFVDGLSENERKAYQSNEPLFNNIYFTVPRIVRLAFLITILGLWIYVRMNPGSVIAERILIQMIAGSLIEPWVSESLNKWRVAIILGATLLITQLVLML